MNIEVVQVHGKDALAELQRLRKEFRTSRKYPFLIGDKSELDALKVMGEEGVDLAEIVSKSLAYNVEQEIKEIRSEIEEMGEEGILGEWPDDEPEQHSISLHKDVLTGKVKPAIFLGMAKIDQLWKLPAVVNFGSWNSCPSAPVHCAYHRKWQKEYGSQIIGMSGSILECAAAKPPDTHELAIELAVQQYRYCPDIVDQGCGSISDLAATLYKAKYWYFWWD